jgi:hypothetical protein
MSKRTVDLTPLNRYRIQYDWMIIRAKVVSQFLTHLDCCACAIPLAGAPFCPSSSRHNYVEIDTER